MKFKLGDKVKNSDWSHWEFSGTVVGIRGGRVAPYQISTNNGGMEYHSARDMEHKPIIKNFVFYTYDGQVFIKRSISYELARKIL